MNLQHALTQISDIHAQLARAQVFRGYRSLTTLATGVVALIAGIIQQCTIQDPAASPHVAEGLTYYALIWVSAAILNLAIVAAEMIYRSRRSGSRLQTDLTLLAIEQFVPALFAGGIFTSVILFYAPQAGGWLLPGMWQIMFSLGVFASCRLLPRPTFWIACFYMLTGGFSLILGLRGLSPWLMAAPFALGQTAAAIILYVCLEHRKNA